MDSETRELILVNIISAVLAVLIVVGLLLLASAIGLM